MFSKSVLFYRLKSFPSRGGFFFETLLIQWLFYMANITFKFRIIKRNVSKTIYLVIGFLLYLGMQVIIIDTDNFNRLPE
jgi:hypothetical protein